MGGSSGSNGILARRQATLLLLATFAVLAPFRRVRAQEQESGDGTASAESKAGLDAGASPDEPSDTAPRDPHVGAVTHLPIPRYVSLKTNEGNARRGPGLTHQIDWVFTRAGMPLKVTAEYEHWRRVEDQDGAGGWVHYSLLSGVRSVLVITDMSQFLDTPDPQAGVVFQAELNVIGRLLSATADWARVSVQGESGWVKKTALWGVDPGEIFN